MALRLLVLVVVITLCASSGAFTRSSSTPTQAGACAGVADGPLKKPKLDCLGYCPVPSGGCDEDTDMDSEGSYKFCGCDGVESSCCHLIVRMDSTDGSLKYDKKGNCPSCGTVGECILNGDEVECDQ